MKTNPNDPNSPITIRVMDAEHRGYIDKTFQGLTKREHFAAMVDVSDYAGIDAKIDTELAEKLTGRTAPSISEYGDNYDLERIKFWMQLEAVIRVMKADALIEALNKEEQ